MLDLIIPVYKNMAGLYRSLFSIGTETNKQVYVTIVDDCSGDKYDDVVKFFQKFFPIRVLYMPENKGPGMARQYGLDNATQPYVSFLDCGDTYVTPTRLKECLNTVRENPQCHMFSWSHVEEHLGMDDFSRSEYHDVAPNHNRMHGKIYRREFLVNHNIHFSEEGSRANEDIGFNIATRLIANCEGRRDNIARVYQDDVSAVVWKGSGPSIVRADNCAFYYKEQNVGMAINGEHILNIARQNNVDEDMIIHEIYEEMVHMYVFYFATKNIRPEYLERTLSGALRYYCNCFRDYGDKDPELLKQVYWDVVASFLQDPNEPIRAEFSNLDFPGFLNMLENMAYNNNDNKENCPNCENSICAHNQFSYQE